jgi:hypothetical protein
MLPLLLFLFRNHSFFEFVESFIPKFTNVKVISNFLCSTIPRPAFDFLILVLKSKLLNFAKSIIIKYVTFLIISATLYQLTYFDSSRNLIAFSTIRIPYL